MGDVAGSLLSVLDGVSPISILVAVVGLLAALLIRRKLDTVGAGKDVGVNRESKESVGTSCKERKKPNAFVQDDAKASSAPHVKVVFGTQGGKASRMAQELAEELRNSEGLAEQVVVLDSAKVLDPEEFLTAESSSGGVLALLVSTYTDGAAPESARWLDRWLEESAKDFRVQRSTLRGLRFSVFGLGDSAYGRERFNAAAKRIDRNLRDLGAVRVLPVALGDDGGSLEADFEEWKESLVRRIGAEDVVAHTEDESQESALEEDFSTSDEEMKNGGSEDEDDLVDLEDIGEVMAKAKVEKKNGVLRRSEQDTKKEMLNPSLRKSLTKQGYKLVGSHSGVKICRWTKAMLRGRGGCYKHSFYGIASHRCMEVKFNSIVHSVPRHSYFFLSQPQVWPALTSVSFAGVIIRTRWAPNGSGPWTLRSSSWKGRWKGTTSKYLLRYLRTDRFYPTFIFQDGQADARRPRSKAREDGGSDGRQALRPLFSRGAHHVPGDQQVHRPPPLARHLQLPGDERPVPLRHSSRLPRHPALRLYRCPHQRLLEEDRSAAVQGLLGEVR